MYVIDPKFGNCTVSRLKKSKQINYTVITVIKVNLCTTNKQELLCKGQSNNFFSRFPSRQIFPGMKHFRQPGGAKQEMYKPRLCVVYVPSWTPSEPQYSYAYFLQMNAVIDWSHITKSSALIASLRCVSRYKPANFLSVFSHAGEKMLHGKKHSEFSSHFLWQRMSPFYI